MNFHKKAFAFIFGAFLFFHAFAFSDEFPLELVNGTPCVRVSINEGAPVIFILDTGATDTMVTPAAARQAGLHVMTGLDGNDNALIKSMAFGGVTMPARRTYVMDPPQARSLRTQDGVNYQGLIGHDLLSRFCLRVDYGRKQWALVKSGETAIPKGDESSADVSMVFKGSRPFVFCQLDGGKPVKFMVDTASSETIVFPVAAKELGLKVEKSRVQADTWFCRPEVKVGKASLSALPCLVDFPQQLVGFKLDYQGILGSSFLSRFVMEMDYPAGRLRLLPVPAVEKSGAPLP